MTSNLIRTCKLAAWLLLVLVILLLVVLPLLTSLLVKAGQMPMSWLKYLSYVGTVQVYMMRGLGVAWVFFLGACFASFLNVVAWRIPRGRGINGSSMCPFCETKLRFSDNLPVIGWIRNGGRCRTCRLPISPRYLVVEIILGCIFVMVCAVEILAGGANLPLRAMERLQGFEHLVFDPKWELIRLCVYHLILICLLFTFALIRSERLRIPLSIFLTGVVFGIGLPMIWPSISLVTWQIGADHLIVSDRFSLDQVLTLSFGMIGGLACGLLVSWATANAEVLRNDKSAQSTIEQSNCIDDIVAGLVLIGLFLGWHSAFSVSLLMIAFNAIGGVILPRSMKRHVNSSTQMLAATLVHLVNWRVSSWLEYWPSPTASNLVMIASAVVLVVAAIAMRFGLSGHHSRRFENELG